MFIGSSAFFKQQVEHDVKLKSKKDLCLLDDAKKQTKKGTVNEVARISK